jgi:hypothetical protein
VQKTGGKKTKNAIYNVDCETHPRRTGKDGEKGLWLMGSVK